MTPVELYWPPEMLAQVYPEEFGHLLSPPPKPTSYTAEHLAGGCMLYRLTERPYLHRDTLGRGAGLAERMRTGAKMIIICHLPYLLGGIHPIRRQPK